MKKVNRKFLKQLGCMLLLACLLLTAGCGGGSGGTETTAATEDRSETTAVPETTAAPVTEPETTAPAPENPVMELVGTWERAYTEVEGDRVETAPGVCTIVITGESEDQLSISYTDREFPEENYAGKALSSLPPEDHGLFEEALCILEVHHQGPFGTTYRIGLLEDGTLLVENYWTMDGAPMVSYAWFRRVE